MNFSKKNHDLVDQNEMNVKKSQKHDANLQKNSTLYFQVGLILSLLAAYALFEMQFERIKTEVSYDQIIDEPEVFANVILIEEENSKQEQKIEQSKKKLITKDPIVVKNTTVIPIKTSIFITEPVLPTGPIIDPDNFGKLEEKPEDKTYTVIGVEQVPIFPGCEGLQTNTERIECMSKKLNKLVNRSFDTDVVAELGLSGVQRIYLNFTIDEKGNITEIKARHTHKGVQKEALKVAKKIPKMEPGKQSDKNVKVMYSLPIIVKVNY